MSLDLSVLWVIVLVLLVIGLLNTLLFKPVLRVIHERARTVSSAQRLAEKAAADATAAAQQYEQQTHAARAEVHGEMDEVRRAAEGRRAALLAAARAQAQVELADATALLASETETARSRLGAEADALGAEIVERVLGRRAS